MIRLTRFLTEAERVAMNDDAMARGYYRDDRRIFEPGWGWFEPWYFDPAHPDPRRCRPGDGFLSRMYWETASKTRSPICVVCPNGAQWEIDRKSSNGEGWTVTGEWPNLTCAPSIVVPGYHGFLTAGVFTANLDDPTRPDGVPPYPSTWRNEAGETIDGDPPAGFRRS